jgi:hypothetical protein
VPLGLAAAFLSHRQLKRVPIHERAHKIDVVGAVLMMTSAIALLLALTWGGTRYPWLSQQIAFLLALAVALTVLFVWWVLRAPEPFLPIAVMKNPVMRAGSLTSACSQGVAIGLTVFIPLYYEMVHGLSASDSGLALIPIVIMTTPGSFLSGRCMLHLNRYKWFPLLMLSITAAAVGLLAIHPLMPVWVVAVVAGLIGMGTGSSYPVVTVSIQNAVAHQQIGIAMGAMNFFRALASSFVVAVMGAIMLAHLGTAPQRGGITATIVTTAGDVTMDHLARTFSHIFALAAVVLIIGIVSLFVMEERPLRTTVRTAP